MALNLAGSLANLKKYRFLLHELVVREIKIKYKRSALGIVWSVLNPLLMMIITNIVFSGLFRMDIPNFLVYYLTAFLLFGFMQEATAGSLYAIFGNAGLINKVYIPKYIFPLAKAESALVNFLFSLVALTLVAAFTGVHASLALLAAPLLFVVFFFFVLGLSLIFATYAVFFRDLIHFHGILMLMWMYVTPTFYPEKLLSDRAPWVLSANPIYYFVRCFRLIVLDGVFPSVQLALECVAISLVSLCIGLLVFRRNQGRFVLFF
jgi:ABC-2 type transport system permease protein